MTRSVGAKLSRKFSWVVVTCWHRQRSAYKAGLAAPGFLTFSSSFLTLFIRTINQPLVISPTCCRSYLRARPTDSLSFLFFIRRVRIYRLFGLDGLPTFSMLRKVTLTMYE